MKDLKLKDSISALFEELKRELHELTTQGIRVKSNGQEYTITVAISTMLGDNLGKFLFILIVFCNFKSILFRSV